MDGKKHKHIDVFRTLIPSMAEKNFMKTAEQMQLKQKTLKLTYLKCKRANVVSAAGKNSCSFYDELGILHGYRPSSRASSGIDTAMNTKIDKYCDMILGIYLLIIWDLIIIFV